ncbi:MAG UNVERIFIED_CONTAM: hypothetical protein LVR18_45765 [Planctomycetaceae bacterium]|jgi:hypothetical protein
MTGHISASSLTVRADAFNLPLNTSVSTLSFTATTSASDFRVIETDGLTVTASNAGGGSVSIQAGGLLNIAGAISNSSEIDLTATSGGLTVNAGLTSSGTISLSSTGNGY